MNEEERLKLMDAKLNIVVAFIMAVIGCACIAASWAFFNY
jgi:hypothetical protein